MFKILSVIVIVAMSVSIFILYSQIETSSRWQDRAISNYNQSLMDNQKPLYQPEDWWTDNPIVVGFKVWIFDVNNYISLFIGLLSETLKRLYYRTRRKFYGTEIIKS